MEITLLRSMVVFAVGAALAAPLHAQQGGAQTEPGRRALAQAGLNAGITVFPVRLVDRHSSDVGDALGLLFEQQGLTDVEPALGAFKPDPATAWDDVPARFAEYVRQNPLRTEFAIYAEILGSPGAGVDELRWLIVDARGQTALSDRLKRGDAELARLIGDHPEPMTCCVAIRERLFKLAGWRPGGAPPKGAGTFERIWAEKSGTPDEAERDAIYTRLGKFKREFKTASIAVLPTRIDQRQDAASAGRLAAAMNARLATRAAVHDVAASIDVRASINEQRKLWDFAKGLRAQLSSSPVDADYVIVADVIADFDQSRVAAVHFVICDRAGQWVAVDYQNDHHAEFKRIGPKTLEDCERLVVERLAVLVN